MTPYIIAEVAQGYEGDPAVARMLVRAAKAGGADAVKIQMVQASDLCEPGYTYHDLFRTLEMDEVAWGAAADLAHSLGIAFVAELFGPAMLDVAERIGADAYKIHSTCFFDHALVTAILATGKPLYLSVGGIEPAEITAFLDRHSLRGRPDVVILFGYQAEPTPIDGNNLARIASLRQLTGLEVGFMDHSDGGGPDWLNLPLVALGMGVRVFEKHITLDRALEMEDFVSALGPTDFAAFSAILRRMAGAIGNSAMDLTEAEHGYRGRALKRVIAARDLPAGHRLRPEDLRLNRPAFAEGLFKTEEAEGRSLAVARRAGEPIRTEDLA